MIKRIQPFIFILGLISCNNNTVTVDYFGQTEPGTTPKIFAEDIISVKGRFEHGISFTPDTRELVFGILNKNDFSGDIYYANKVNNKWTIPEDFEPLKDKSVYLPYFSPNGKSLLFTQSKSDTNYNYKDIWIIKKNENYWRHPEKLKIPLSEHTSVSNACMSIDKTVYFSSNINCIGVDNCFTADLFSSDYKDSTYQKPKEIHALNSQFDEESVFISPSENYMLLCRYSTNKFGPDLFVSYRNVNEEWIQAIRLDSTINTTNWERRPFVSNDNKYLFFTKLTLNMTGLQESDIYWVSTQKVFKPFVFNPIAKRIINVGEKIKLSIPSDYFKDIDSENLEIRVNLEKFDWIEYDNEKMTLNPSEIGEFDLIFTAIDRFSNETSDTVKIIVEE